MRIASRMAPKIRSRSKLVQKQGHKIGQNGTFLESPHKEVQFLTRNLGDYRNFY